MEERWLCRKCGRSIKRPDTRYDYDDGLVATVTHLCPKCGSDSLEELEQCPACGYGWKRKGEHVCEKCHLRLKGDLQRFARQYGPASLAELDDMLDGTGLELFT